MDWLLMRRVLAGGGVLPRSVTQDVVRAWGRDGPPRGWLGERVWWLARYPNGAGAVHVAVVPSGDELWCAACQQFHGRQGIVLELMSTTLLVHCRATGAVLAEC